MKTAALLCTALLVMSAGPAAMPAPAQRSHLVVIVGAAGDPVYEEVFHNWALALIDGASEHMGLSDEQITYLGAKPEIDEDRVTARSSRENIEAVLTQLADEAGVDDRVFVVLIGHGSGAGEQSKFNIPGRDLSALEYDALLDRFVSQQVAFINTASASGDFTTVLAAPNRVIVTATRDARQNNQTVFPRFFVEAFAADVADLDKDERLSLLEAYNYASLEVKRFYTDEGRMLTETSQLEDNGDGEGSHEPSPGVTDGALARRLFLSAPAAVTTNPDSPAAADAAMLSLYEQQRELRERIDDLKLLKGTMDADVYASELETLLIALARKDQEIRARGGKR